MKLIGLVVDGKKKEVTCQVLPLKLGVTYPQTWQEKNEK